MIHLVIGRQGSGKTLLLVRKAYEFYKKGYKIYSNVHLKFPYKKLDYNDIINCKLENGLVILDEVHLLLSSRNSMSKRNREICDSFLSMVRKKNLTIYGSTQTERKVDIRFREEKDYIHICNKYAYINKKWVECSHNLDLDINVPIMIKSQVQEMFSGGIVTVSFLGNDLFKLYDSRQIIAITGLKY